MYTKSPNLPLVHPAQLQSAPCTMLRNTFPENSSPCRSYDCPPPINNPPCLAILTFRKRIINNIPNLQKKHHKRHYLSKTQSIPVRIINQRSFTCNDNENPGGKPSKQCNGQDSSSDASQDL